MTGKLVRSILIVDDDEMVLEVLLQMAEEFGDQVAGASSGRQALEILESTSVDLLVTDVRMPGLNGIDLVRRVREQELAKYVVIVTGFAGPAEEQLTSELAAVLLRKPFRAVDLRAAVRRAVASES